MPGVALREATADEAVLTSREELDAAIAHAKAARQAASSDALPAARAAVAVAERVSTGDDPAWREAHDLLLHALLVAGRLRELADVARRLEVACAAAGDEVLRFTTLRRLALAGVELGDFGTAIEAAEAAHRLATARADVEQTALALGSLGWCFERIGDAWQAERLMRDALAIARPLGPGRTLFAALNNLAVALIGRFHLMRDTGDPATAREALVEALPLMRETVGFDAVRAEPYADVVATGNLGEILLHLGGLDEAEQRLRHADDVAAREGLVAQWRRNGANLGEALLARGCPQEAWDLLQQRLAGGDAADEPVTRMRLHHALSRAAEALGRPAQALHHLQAYLTLERRRAVQQLQAQSRLLVSRREAEQARQDLRDQERRAAALEREVQRDPLTGLGNRREADRRLPELLARAVAERRPLNVAMLDLDHFKRVNDAFGHPVGDQVLRRFAQVVAAQLRGHDLLVRLGGEEFLLVLPDATPEAAREVVERLRRAVQAEPWDGIAPGLAVTVSIGLSSGDGPDPTALLRRADEALYCAKAGGRNAVVVA